MREALAVILDFYRRPFAAPSRAMDECSLLWAAVPAIVLCLIMGVSTGPLGSSQRRTFRVPSRLALPAVSDDDTRPVREVPWQDRVPSLLPGFRSLLVLAVVFTPSAILIWVLWKGPGGFATILMRDYAPALVCLLNAWSAAYLLVVLGVMFLPAQATALSLLGFAYFAFLAACCLRTVMGVGMGAALAISTCAYIVSFAGLIAFGMFGNVVYYLASPWFLFYFYRQFQSGAMQLTSGLSSRQSFRRSLAASTLNPRDADAQYQLGLIYSSRRQYTEALNRFTKAAEIDPRDAGSRYELGRIALQQQRYQDAFDHFYMAAELDSTHAAYAVWRDIGIACYHLGDFGNAVSALERYVAKREYDPEGLYWFGMALAAANQRERAADSWRKTIEAVRTMPSHRRRQMKQWESKANAELKAR